MSGLIRLVLSPVILPVYFAYGAIKGIAAGTGMMKGAMVGAIFGVNYVATGCRLTMGEEER